jgi:hypothetical protein
VVKFPHKPIDRIGATINIEGVIQLVLADDTSASAPRRGNDSLARAHHNTLFEGISHVA